MKLRLLALSLVPALVLASPAIAQCEMAQVTHSGGNYFEYFGQSVATAGTFAVVGGPRYGTPSSEAGVALIYKVASGVWSLDVSVQPSIPNSGDQFGRSVATDGTRVVVGAPFDDTGASNNGAIYVFRNDSGTWAREAKLTPGNSVANQQFGVSVAISGSRIAVGGPGASGGKVFTFTRSGTTWTAEATLTPSAAFSIGRCGHSVALDGNWLIAGAEESNPGSFGHPDGAAFLFQYTSSWAQHTTLTSPTTTAHARYGLSVSLSGTTAAVGAPWENSIGFDGGGHVHTYEYVSSAWSLQQTIAPYDVHENEYFGWSVSLLSDGLAVGSYLGDATGTDSGAAYFYKFNGTDWTQRARLIGSDSVSSDVYGSSVSISSSYAIVGAEGRDSYKGAAYLISRCP